ncbi:MAG TPA: hypothetical protein VHG08_04270 [Longimicrobium sp.]|nr:hypothetical protein [Longimicrobium sp.]
MRIVMTVAAGLLAACAGCTRWQPAALPAPRAEQGPLQFRHARVSTVENAVFVLRGAAVTADSVTGWHEISTGAFQPVNRQRIALHRSQVRAIEQASTDEVRTTVFVAAMAGLGAFLHYLARI